MPYLPVNGFRMYYEVHGAGPRLLSLHGGTGSINPDSVVIPFLATRFRVIAIEQMGHGRTADAMDPAFHYHDMAEDTIELLGKLDIESAAIVGFSDGGIIGLDIAIHHPDRLTKLVVSGANVRTDGYTAENLAWIRTFRPEDEPVSDAYARLSPDGAAHWPTFFERLRPMWEAEPDFTPAQVEGIKAPTLIIVGDRDIVRPEHCRRDVPDNPGFPALRRPARRPRGDAEGDDPRVPA